MSWLIGWNKLVNKRSATSLLGENEQDGTGRRMMREEWQKLGHPVPRYKNDRAWKAFKFFIPELDKEVDMASDLMKTMFGDTRPESPTQSRPSRDQATGEVRRLKVFRLEAIRAGFKKAWQERDYATIIAHE